MEIRVQFPRERTRPTGSVRGVWPAAERPIDPGAQANDRRHNEQRERERHDGPPDEGGRPSDPDIGGHVDKTA